MSSKLQSNGVVHVQCDGAYCRAIYRHLPDVHLTSGTRAEQEEFLLLDARNTALRAGWDADGQGGMLCRKCANEPVVQDGQDRHYPIISTIYGSQNGVKERYLTRIKLTPMTPRGQLYFHIFWRGDQDADPHDHPFDFWTFPFTTYWERYLHRFSLLPNKVRAWRWHYRPATYAHLVDGPADYCHYTPAGDLRRLRDNDGRTTKTFCTLVWRTPNKRKWGFWVHVDTVAQRWPWIVVDDERLRWGERVFVPWCTYVYNERVVA